MNVLEVNEILNVLFLFAGVHSLGSPQWGEEAGIMEGGSYDPSLCQFLFALRATLRSSYATAIITMPTHLFQVIITMPTHLFQVIITMPTHLFQVIITMPTHLFQVIITMPTTLFQVIIKMLAHVFQVINCQFDTRDGVV